MDLVRGWRPRGRLFHEWIKSFLFNAKKRPRWACCGGAARRGAALRSTVRSGGVFGDVTSVRACVRPHRGFRYTTNTFQMQSDQYIKFIKTHRLWKQQQSPQRSPKQLQTHQNGHISHNPAVVFAAYHWHLTESGDMYTHSDLLLNGLIKSCIDKRINEGSLRPEWESEHSAPLRLLVMRRLRFICVIITDNGPLLQVGQ